MPEGTGIVSSARSWSKKSIATKFKRKEILAYRLGTCFKQELSRFLTIMRSS